MYFIQRVQHNIAPLTLWLLCILTLVTCQQASAFHTPAQKLDERFNKVSFNQPLRYQLTDKQVRYNDIDHDPELHHSWLTTKVANPSFRLKSQALWLSASVKNVSKDPMTIIVDFTSPLADEIDYFVTDASNDRLIKTLATGTDYDFSRRELPYRSFAMELTLQPQQVANIYLRIVDSGSIFVHWGLWNKDVFVAQKLKASNIDGLLAGALLIFFILNLVVYFGLKERMYIYFSGFLASYTLMATILNGTAFQHLWPTSPEINQSSIYVASGLVLLFVSLYSQVTHQGRSKQWVELLQYVNILLSAFVIFLPLFVAIEYHLLVLVCVTLVVITIGVFTAYWAVYQRQSQAILHALIWTVFLIGGGLLALSRYGIISSDIYGHNQASSSVVITAMILAFSLVKRIRLEKSEKEQAKSQAAESLQQYVDVYQNAVEGLFTLSAQGQLISANPHLVAALGYSDLAQMRQNIEHHGIEIIISDIDQAKQLLANLTKNGSVVSQEIQGLKRDGSHIWGLMSMRQSSSLGPEQDCIQGAVVDITEKHQAYQKLAYMATHDTLTGVLNRSEFEKMLYSALTELKQNEQPATMLYLDLERFKLINDTSGHVAGDSLLRQVSDQLKSVLNDQGTLARLGGDEFAILLPGINGNEAFVIAYRIIEAVKEFRFLWEERIFTVGVSIGMKELSADDSSLTQIFTRADAACYVAKEKGRNRIHIYSHEDQDLQHHQSQMEWIGVINNALDNDQFILYHQLIRSTARNEDLHHYEILLRMRDEHHNIIPPDTFIPAAERYNLMTSIDRWVIRSYFRWLSQNPEHMKALGQCSINLSGASIADPHFKEIVLDLFVEFLIPHSKICFEITESIAIINLNATLDFINQFKDLGCKFSLDDFGTGFSSYGYLKNLPVDFV